MIFLNYYKYWNHMRMNTAILNKFKDFFSENDVKKWYFISQIIFLFKYLLIIGINSALKLNLLFWIIFGSIIILLEWFVVLWRNDVDSFGNAVAAHRTNQKKNL